jgi:cysteine-rich repeat protein
MYDRGMRAVSCVVAAVLAACLEPGLIPCGELSCPVGTSCVAGELCAFPDQIAACEGLADGESCAAASRVGRCDRGVCVATGCGNSDVEPGEQCDDGNAEGGDGCSADCSKIEMCGDGISDEGEQCDDGNVNPADGCDACVATSWQATPNNS